MLGISSLQAAYPDQFLTWPDAAALWDHVANSDHIRFTSDRLVLDENAFTGSITFEPIQTASPFNIALASWNGSAPESGGGFRVFIRFPWGAGWSPWLEMGYWQDNYWPGSKTTSYSGGYINIDTGILYYDRDQWQAKVEFSRDNTSIPSPSIHRFSMQVSDAATTDSLDLAGISADNPPAIFIPTQFIYQFSVDPDIGGRICSPTTTAMILGSLGQTVDMLDFAWDTYDPYYQIFGVWPRAVQSASRYHVEGYVNRYRTWSEAYEVLAAGGRIAMSVGQPLYSGHLLMLAGFNSNGQPIVHDPARSNGYSYIYNKSSLSQAWFAKGGVAYTFFPHTVASVADNHPPAAPHNFKIEKIFPNPFNAATRITFSISEPASTQLRIFNLNGQLVTEQNLGFTTAGNYTRPFDGSHLSSGIYYCQLIFHTRSGSWITVSQKFDIIK